MFKQFYRKASYVNYPYPIKLQASILFYLANYPYLLSIYKQAFLSIWLTICIFLSWLPDQKYKLQRLQEYNDQQTFQDLSKTKQWENYYFPIRTFYLISFFAYNKNNKTSFVTICKTGIKQKCHLNSIWKILVKLIIQNSAILEEKMQE